MVFAMSLPDNGSMKHCKCLLCDGCKRYTILSEFEYRDISSYQNSNNRGITAHGLHLLGWAISPYTKYCFFKNLCTSARVTVTGIYHTVVPHSIF